MQAKLRIKNIRFTQILKKINEVLLIFKILLMNNENVFISDINNHKKCHSQAQFNFDPEN